jgi:hypothetical protein
MGIPEVMHQAMQAFPPTQEHKEAALLAALAAAQQFLAAQQQTVSEAVTQLTYQQLPEVAEEVWHQYCTLSTSKLLSKELVAQLPPLYAQEHEPDPMVYVKFFHPNSHWTWYAYEFDGLNTFFGWVYGDFPELGYFTLTELAEAKDPLGIGVERDEHFTPMRLSEVKQLHPETPAMLLNPPQPIIIFFVEDEEGDGQKQ